MTENSNLLRVNLTSTILTGLAHVTLLEALGLDRNLVFVRFAAQWTACPTDRLGLI